jgi:hypothetical protein
MTTEAKRVGRLLSWTWPNGGSATTVNLDTVVSTTRNGLHGTVYVRLMGGNTNMLDVPTEHGDAFLAALEARADEVG